MAMFGDDADREQFFEAARQQAQKEYESDPTNSQALVRWGGALLELAHYKQGQESKDMIQLAITKLQKAIELDPERTDAEWCLGNAYTSMGFLCETKSKAVEQFGKASECFKRCERKDPSNETYKKAIEMCNKAPEYYDEIQAHLQSSGAETSGSKKDSSANDLWWDLGGWVLLGVVVAGALVIARSGAATAKPAA